jgi:hypothetical protein
MNILKIIPVKRLSVNKIITQSRIFVGTGLKSLAGLTIIILMLLVRCESKERFYRPNLQEKLCSIGIIDVDDTTRYISFEKSYQIEYPEEVNDSLRDFSFTISSAKGEVFKYLCDSTVKNVKDLKIPENIKFSPGEKYYLQAKERSTPSISADISVTESPSKPSLTSINREISTLSKPLECTGYTTFNSAVISISFKNYSKQKLYYALLIQGTGYRTNFNSFLFQYSGFLDFSVRKCNAPGFFAEMQGIKMYHRNCNDNHISIKESPPVLAYFIDGIEISDNECHIILSIKFHDDLSPFEIFRSFRIKLLSIPKELYFFEKSLYTYNKVKEDPFSEPVYLNGNIKEGNGVFALCRSSDLIIDLPIWY